MPEHYEDEIQITDVGLTEVGVDPERRAEEIDTLVASAIRASINHYEENIEPDVVDATDYYRGELFDDDADENLEGRSSVVSSDVRDATLAQLPSLLRIFFGSKDAVEFRPRTAQDIPVARQQTDTINYTIREDNDGFTVFHSAFKDALVRRLGVVKWWWDEFNRVEAQTYTGLAEPEIQALLMEQDVEDVELLAYQPADPRRETPDLFDVRLTWRQSEGRARFDAVPREEFVYTPGSRGLDNALCIAHVREMPADELLAMGVDEDLVEGAVQKKRAEDADSTEAARDPDSYLSPINRAEWTDSSQRPVLFAEAYMRVDGDGDDIGELRMFQCVGPDFEIVNGTDTEPGEIVDEIPFAVFCPEPEPHTMEGLSNFDLVGDIQKIKSHVQRATLNSLAAAVEPAMEAVIGEVNVSDLVSPEVNKIVRVNKPGMLREIKHTFVGGETLPVLEYFDHVKEERTGISKASAGLDADSLQSSTKAAVAATLSGAQQRIEMIARIFAETGMKRLFKGLLGLLVRNQERARIIRLRDRYVAVDPRHWDATMDVSVNVALGAGPTEEKVGAWVSLAEKMEAHIQQGSPLFNFVTLRNVYSKILEALDETEVDTVLNPWDEQMQQQWEQQQAEEAENAPPDPAEIIAQAEQLKVQLKATEHEHEKQLDWWTARREDDRERDKQAQDQVMKELELELKHTADLLDAQVQTQIATARQGQTVGDADG